MSRSRSPSYPSFPLSEAISRVEHVFDADRQNPVDRETIAQHIGYRGLSGASDKAISTLSHYGLLEKVAKGELRVSSLAVDILHPVSSGAKAEAIAKAARHPSLFAQLFDRFDVTPSAGALESYLKREGYLERAIKPISSAYLETCQFLEQSGVTREAEGEQNDDQEVHYDSEVGFRDGWQFATARADAVGRLSDPLPAADIFNFVNGGLVSVQLPVELSREEWNDLKDWLELMARRAERRVVSN